MKCKVFVLSYQQVVDAKIVNEWLEANPKITVTHIAQSQDPAQVTITLLYK